MSKIRLFSLSTAQDATVTSIPIQLGAKQPNRDSTITTLLITGKFGSANGDTVRVEVGADSASGDYAQELLDPMSVLNHIDASGEFVAAGAVNIITAPGVFLRAIFRAPSAAGDSSIKMWAIGAVNSADASGGAGLGS